jgi:carboxyl-terminal processing protease
MKKNIFIFIAGVITSFVVMAFILSGYLVPIMFYRDVESKFDGNADSQEMLEHTLSGITSGFGDPHTAYIPKEQVEQFNQALDTTYEGIGVMYSIDNPKGTAQITKVMPNSPASQQNIYPGDMIMKVNDVPVDATNVEDLTSMIKADKTVKLELYRPSTTETIFVEMQLAEYVNDSVESQVFYENGQTIGYIKILSFSDTTEVEFAQHLEALEAQGIDKLIIDVRDNGGGELQAVEAICNLIVPNTKPYLIIKEGDEVVDTYTSTLETPKEYEIIGIQNENTASASEILMGALKEVNGSTIIGTTSYGKGSVQRVYPVSSTGGAVKITVQHWFTPDGNSIDEVGIEPTIVVENTGDMIPVEPIVLNENLNLGTTGTQVRQVNYYLHLLGYDVDTESNTYNSKTQSAVMQFQADNGLNTTGEVDILTAKVLYENASLVINTPENDPQLEYAMGV